MNKELEEVLDYMKKYVKDKDLHYSEPMLNYKDLELVLEYIKNLKGKNEALHQKIKALEDRILWQDEHV